jgi:hypothetical protein
MFFETLGERRAVPFEAEVGTLRRPVEDKRLVIDNAAGSISSSATVAPDPMSRFIRWSSDRMSAAV